MKYVIKALHIVERIHVLLHTHLPVWTYKSIRLSSGIVGTEVIQVTDGLGPVIRVHTATAYLWQCVIYARTIVVVTKPDATTKIRAMETLNANHSEKNHGKHEKAKYTQQERGYTLERSKNRFCAFP